MSIQELVQDLSQLDEAQLTEVGQYVAFVKHRSRVSSALISDEETIASLYREASSEDRELAEAGMDDYAAALAREDAR